MLNVELFCPATNRYKGTKYISPYCTLHTNHILLSDVIILHTDSNYNMQFIRNNIHGDSLIGHGAREKHI